MNGGGSLLNDEAPAVAGDVPEKLVVVFEKAEEACGIVGQRVDVTAAREQSFGIAKVDGLAVVALFDAERFVGAVARSCEHPEADDVVVVGEIAIAGGEFAVNAVADLVAGSV